MESAQRNMMDVTTDKDLLTADLWKTPELKKHYKPSEIYELLYDVSENKELTFYDRNTDPTHILFEDFPRQETETKEDQIINIIVPEGVN